jgi:hypothetical protein
MAIVFTNGTKELHLSWPVADELMGLLEQVGAQIGDEFSFSPDQAKDARRRLSEAHDQNRIGLYATDTDPMGRTFVAANGEEESFAVLSLDGPIPLDDQNHAFVDDVLAFLA